MWSEQKTGGQAVVSGHPDRGTSSAAALLSYDVPHKAPWDWRVSLYTWTKGIAAGVYLVTAVLFLLTSVATTGLLWRWVAPAVSGLFLAATGGLLIGDLEQPKRFYYIFTRSQPKSWLVRGAYVIGGYSTILALHFVASLLDRGGLSVGLLVGGVPLAVMTAVYTAYLFAQAKARDLWQNPLLAAQLLIQSCLAGAAALLPFAVWLEPGSVAPLLWIVSGSATVHLLFVAAEATVTHPTAHARLAAHEMVRGRYARFFWPGLVLSLLSVAAPWIGISVVPIALVGLLSYEHAYVQAGQAVPLA
jgi:formate-dependent nitrite reductase membrane component NrfD